MRKFKIFLFYFFIFHLAFSMLAEDLLDLENIFPFYTWKIFHTRPDKFWERHFLYVHRIDNEAFNPPKDILDIKDKFPKIRFYTFTQKVHRLAYVYSKPEGLDLVKAINENLNLHYKKVEWVLTQKKVDIIDFYLHRNVLESKTLGHYVATLPEAEK